MKQDMNANKIEELEKDLTEIKKDIEKIEKKVYNGGGK